LLKSSHSPIDTLLHDQERIVDDFGERPSDHVYSPEIYYKN
jgi:hypothetical protein